MITITYDEEAGAIYVKVRSTAVSTTEDYSDAVKADFDSDERLVGVEILDVKAPPIRRWGASDGGAEVTQNYGIQLMADDS